MCSKALKQGFELAFYILSTSSHLHLRAIGKWGWWVRCKPVSGDSGFGGRQCECGQTMILKSQVQGLMIVYLLRNNTHFTKLLVWLYMCVRVCVCVPLRQHVWVSMYISMCFCTWAYPACVRVCTHVRMVWTFSTNWLGAKCKDLNCNAESRGHALWRFTIDDPAKAYSISWCAHHGQSTNHRTTIVEYSFPPWLKLWK